MTKLMKTEFTNKSTKIKGTVVCRECVIKQGTSLELWTTTKEEDNTENSGDTTQAIQDSTQKKMEIADRLLTWFRIHRLCHIWWQ